MGKIFVSYRRKDVDFAHRLSEKLAAKIDGTVFIDRNISESDFEQALLRQIRECNAFVLIVTENTFERKRIVEPDDWIRREIALALQLDKPITLALREGQGMPPPETLPQECRKIVTRQGLPFYASLFDECVDNFAKHCVTISNGGLKLRQDVPQFEPVAAVSYAGDNSVNLPGASISGHVEISTGASKRQEARALKQNLLDERSKLVKLAAMLSYDKQRGMTFEGIVFSLVITAVVVGGAYLLHPAAAVVALVILMLLGISRRVGSGNSRGKKQQQLRQIERQISQIDFEVARIDKEARQ